MEKFKIVPMLDPGNADYLPCEESEANRWAVQIDPNTRIVHETREEAEATASRLKANERASRFVWDDDDLEHH